MVLKRLRAGPLSARLRHVKVECLPDQVRAGGRAGVISRTFPFPDFPAAMQFVDAVAVLAEQAWHHPDIDIRWNKVTLALTTHDAGGLTKRDFVLARKFDALSLRGTRRAG